jgi:GntR family transcriptional regulator
LAKRETGGDPGEKQTGTADIVSEIKATIDHHALQPGDRIGAERELAEQYGVGRWVLRNALAQLQADGYIVRTHGRNGGIFVAPRKLIRDLERLVSLPEYLRAQGLETGTTVLATRVEQAEGDVLKDLALAIGDLVYVIDRVRFAEGLPLSVETVWLPANMFPGLLGHSMVGSVYELLESEYQVQRGHAVEVISAAPATRHQAGLLQLAPGEPVLGVQRVAELTDGTPFERGVEFYRFDRMAITAHSEGSGERRHRQK